MTWGLDIMLPKKHKSGYQKKKERKEKERRQNEGRQLLTAFFPKVSETNSGAGAAAAAGAAGAAVASPGGSSEDEAEIRDEQRQGTTTKKGTTAGPSSSTVTEDKTQDKMILIKENMTWEEALYYCEENHHDLVYITNLNEQRRVQEKAKKANSPYVWLGLRYTCTLGFWFWIDDKMVTYKNWDTDVPADDCDMSGAMDRGGEHKWFKKNDNEKFNFICSMC